jgi:hypothetical protein
MELSVLQNAGRVDLAPFPHLVLRNALPWELYRELEATRPAPGFFENGRDPGSNLRMDRHAHECLGNSDVPPPWQEFIAYHTSEKFWHEVVDIFGDIVRLLYPHLEFIKPLENYDCGLRFKDKRADIFMECQPGINTPPLAESRVRGPHVDNPVELVAGLLYMRPEQDVWRGGGLNIHRLKKPYVCHDKAEIDDKYVETVATVPYEPNTLVMFVNTPLSIHSVTPRPSNPLHRLLVNFALELPKPLFKIQR